MRIRLMAGVCLLMAGTPIVAQERAQWSHVRLLTEDLRALVNDTAARSPTFRELLETLDASNVTVYVRPRLFSTMANDGQIGFLVTRTIRPDRILIIELAYPRLPVDQIATLAHELHHATEIAAAPWVVDPSTLAGHYATIGVRTAAHDGRQAFETEGARATAAQVRRELQSVATIASADARRPRRSR